MKSVTAALLSFLALLAILVCIGTVLFIGVGALLARWLPLSIFQASALAIGSTIAVAAIAYVLSTIRYARYGSDLDDDFEDEEDDPDPDIADLASSLPKPDFSKVARNDYCPCGSGKRFKKCCGDMAAK